MENVHMFPVKETRIMEIYFTLEVTCLVILMENGHTCRFKITE